MANASPDLSITRAAKRIAAQLNAQLDRHAASGDAFVVSVYGEWGIGKTYCLRNIQSLFDLNLSSAIESLAPTMKTLAACGEGMSVIHGRGYCPPTG